MPLRPAKGFGSTGAITGGVAIFILHEESGFSPPGTDGAGAAVCSSLRRCNLDYWAALRGLRQVGREIEIVLDCEIVEQSVLVEQFTRRRSHRQGLAIN
jgi:hypothetical protein